MSMPDTLDAFLDRFRGTFTSALPGWIISLAPPVDLHAALAPAPVPVPVMWLLTLDTSPEYSPQMGHVTSFSSVSSFVIGVSPAPPAWSS